MPSSRAWNGNAPPSSILLIRMQALGDLVITLPYAQALRRALPNTRLDLLTRDEVAGIAQQTGIFDKVYVVRGKRNIKLQLLHILWLLPKLMRAKYDVLIDLQNNRLSRIVSRYLDCSAHSEFDLYSPLPAGTRTLNTIKQIGLAPIEPSFDVRPSRSDDARQMLADCGWREGQKVIVLNPAGFLPSRNWPRESYVSFAKIWSQRFDADARFLILGLDRIRDTALFLQREIGEQLISLVGKTTPEQAFAAIGFADLVLSEDSGLMHMAWVRGIPTVALFGSSRSDWSRPLGPHSICLGSADLECGECMLEHCKFGDNRCLTRYSPEFVAETAFQLLNETHAKSENSGRH